MIRKAGLLDINAVYDLAVEAWSKAPYSGIELHELKTREFIKRHIKHESMALFVSDIDGVVGFLGASINRMDMADALAANSTALYVRSGGEGKLLVERYVKWAKKMNAELISMDQSYMAKEKATSAMLAKVGFVRVGGLHYHADGLEV